MTGGGISPDDSGRKSRSLRKHLVGNDKKLILRFKRAIAIQPNNNADQLWQFGFAVLMATAIDHNNNEIVDAADPKRSACKKGSISILRRFYSRGKVLTKGMPGHVQLQCDRKKITISGSGICHIMPTSRNSASLDSDTDQFINEDYTDISNLIFEVSKSGASSVVSREHSETTSRPLQFHVSTEDDPSEKIGDSPQVVSTVTVSQNAEGTTGDVTQHQEVVSKK